MEISEEQVNALLETLAGLVHGGAEGPMGFESLTMALDGHGIPGQEGGLSGAVDRAAYSLDKIADALEKIADALAEGNKA